MVRQGRGRSTDRASKQPGESIEDLIDEFVSRVQALDDVEKDSESLKRALRERLGDSTSKSADGIGREPSYFEAASETVEKSDRPSAGVYGVDDAKKAEDGGREPSYTDAARDPR